MMTDDFVRQISNEVSRQEEQWLSHWIKQLVPPIIHTWTKEGKNLSFVTKFLERQRIHIEVCTSTPGTKTLKHGDKTVATFTVIFKR